MSDRGKGSKKGRPNKKKNSNSGYQIPTFTCNTCSFCFDDEVTFNSHNFDKHWDIVSRNFLMERNLLPTLQINVPQSRNEINPDILNKIDKELLSNGKQSSTAVANSSDGLTIVHKNKHITMNQEALSNENSQGAIQTQSSAMVANSSEIPTKVRKNTTSTMNLECLWNEDSGSVSQKQSSATVENSSESLTTNHQDTDIPMIDDTDEHIINSTHANSSQRASFGFQSEPYGAVLSPRLLLSSPSLKLGSPRDVSPRDAGPQDVSHPEEITLDGSSQDGSSHDDSSQDASPQGVGPQDASPQGVGPQGVGPQGVGPQGVGPQGVGPQSKGAPEIKKHECSYCVHNFELEENYHQHANKHHMEEIMKLWLKCTGCKRYYPSHRSLKKHNCNKQWRSTPASTSLALSLPTNIVQSTEPSTSMLSPVMIQNQSIGTNLGSNSRKTTFDPIASFFQSRQETSSTVLNTMCNTPLDPMVGSSQSNWGKTPNATINTTPNPSVRVFQSNQKTHNPSLNIFQSNQITRPPVSNGMFSTALDQTFSFSQANKTNPSQSEVNSMLHETRPSVSNAISNAVDPTISTSLSSKTTQSEILRWPIRNAKSISRLVEDVPTDKPFEMLDLEGNGSNDWIFQFLSSRPPSFFVGSSAVSSAQFESNSQLREYFQK